MNPVLGTVLLGGVAAADAVPLGQLMISQPLVMAAVIGWLWGDLPLALAVGTVLQLLAAASLPLGARTPEDYAAGGVVGAGTALLLAHGHPFAAARDSAAVLGVVAGMLASLGGMPLQRWQRRHNEGLARWCEAEVGQGRERALLLASWAGVALAFSLGAAYCAACMAAGLALGRPLVEAESLRLSRAWVLARPLWLGFGGGQLLYAFVRRDPHRVMFFAAALVVGWLVRTLGAP